VVELLGWAPFQKKIAGSRSVSTIREPAVGSFRATMAPEAPGEARGSGLTSAKASYQVVPRPVNLAEANRAPRGAFLAPKRALAHRESSAYSCRAGSMEGRDGAPALIAKIVSYSRFLTYVEKVFILAL